MLATSGVVQRDAFRSVYAELVSSPHQLLVVAVDAAEVVGYAHALAHPAFHAGGPVVWVEELMVTESRRRQGVGRVLMAAVEDWSRDCVAAVYVALATRRAADFYAAIGYHDSARYLKKDLTGPAC